MNIQEARQEIINTVQAYLKKDETGTYEIPVERQRPILMIGPPGIGKTAIMEQVARECGINLVSYTITHHTRQSAIGLPFISNCVSETLAPTMLQFLQYKTFGPHRVPDGFLIVTAGNPPQYNRSVRDFDIVTLDRMKKIVIEEDYPAWKDYAYKVGIHGSVMAYLEIRRDHFYSIRTEIDDRYFVTARGWEDLSRVIAVYEKMEIPVTENLVLQYIQDPEIARHFAAYYDLYNKYRNVYRVPDILEGRAQAPAGMKNAPFDEKLSLLGLLIDSLGREFRDYAFGLDVQRLLYSQVLALRSGLAEGGKAASALAEDLGAALKKDLEKKLRAKMISREEEKAERTVIGLLGEMEKDLILNQKGDKSHDFGLVKKWFTEREEARKARAAAAAGDHLTNAFSYLAKTYGEGQEMVIFLTELAGGYYSLKYVSECGNEAYYRYNRLLLLKDQREELQSQVLELLDL